MEPAVDSAERSYAEWVIEECDGICNILIGVTDLDAAVPPAGQDMHAMPGSCMFCCNDSTAVVGSTIKRNWSAELMTKIMTRARGERVGLLVERGCVWVYVDGVRLGPGPMATDLPTRVRETRGNRR